MNYKKLPLVLAIITGVLALVVTLLYLIFSLTDLLHLEGHSFNVLFAVITPASYFVLALSLAYYISSSASLKQLQNENEYIFGEKSLFYNSYYLSKRIKLLMFFKGKQKGKNNYLMAFSPTVSAVSRNTYHNALISKFLRKIAAYLTVEFSVDNQKKENLPMAYCYYHGVFLVYFIGKEIDVDVLSNKIQNKLYNIVEEEQLNIYVQPFFGVTTLPNEPDELVSAIDRAVEARSKAEKRFETICFSDINDVKELDNNQVEELKEALQKKELVVYYQPKFSLKTNQFISTEALIRWNSPKYGLLPPSKFIEAAEKGGLIHSIDEYVLETVCAHMRENRVNCRRNLPVSINFSMQEFYDINFIDEVEDVVKKYGVEPSLIQIEVTESTSQTNNFMSNSIIHRLKTLGFKVLMDDFGTGFSNIENLMILPFDAVKLDRSYIKRIESETKSRELVKFLINLCKASGMEVIAEGVDNKEQVRILRKLECDTIQGYYYSKPIPKQELDKLLAPGGNDFEK